MTFYFYNYFLGKLFLTFPELAMLLQCELTFFHFRANTKSNITFGIIFVIAVDARSIIRVPRK